MKQTVLIRGYVSSQRTYSSLSKKFFLVNIMLTISALFHYFEDGKINRVSLSFLVHLRSKLVYFVVNSACFTWGFYIVMHLFEEIKAVWLLNYYIWVQGYSWWWVISNWLINWTNLLLTKMNFSSECSEKFGILISSRLLCILFFGFCLCCTRWTFCAIW